MEGREGRRRGEGKWYPHFWEKVTPLTSGGVDRSPSFYFSVRSPSPVIALPYSSFLPL